MTGQFQSTEDLHGTGLSVEGAGVLLLGPSGAGKSGLALQLMSLGAKLICDDRVSLGLEGGRVMLGPASGALPAIEARGIGLLGADLAPPAPLHLVLDMGRTETARMPQRRTRMFLGQPVPCLHKIEQSHFPAAILQYVRAGMYPGEAAQNRGNRNG